MVQSTNPDIDNIKKTANLNKDWRERVKKRYIKYVDEILNDTPLNKLCDKFYFAEPEMNSIINRISTHFDEVFR